MRMQVHRNVKWLRSQRGRAPGGDPRPSPAEPAEEEEPVHEEEDPARVREKTAEAPARDQAEVQIVRELVYTIIIITRENVHTLLLTLMNTTNRGPGSGRRNRSEFPATESVGGW
ncbi:UNVERIFIED_CONTAM: hypothetical protein PYX00_000812 [Menopon gallinae]|uniref:Uncharacterized protein n=1 Tax=Menopon gallinae TaxID=328185 RepID=A0AAW2IA13_9NEOP